MSLNTKKSILNKLLSASIAASLLFASCQKDKIQDRSPVTVQPSGSFQGRSIEALSKEYFTANPAESANEAKVVSVINEFLLINKTMKEFNGKTPCRIQPIYAYGIDGVAYYEVWFTEDNKTAKGWVLVSATDKDYPLVNFSQGIPYSSHLLKNDNDGSSKVYRFGVSYYTLEQNGQKTAEYGKMPPYVLISGAFKEFGGKGSSNEPKSNNQVDLREGVDYILIKDYESLKQVFPKNYYSDKRANIAMEMKQRLFPLQGHGEAVGTQTEDYQYRWVGGQQCYYTQIPAYTGKNIYGCWSGCNNNAWTNIYGWWDRNMGKANLIPTTTTGETSPIYRNTTARQNSIDPVQMYIRSVSYTYCGSGTGWTLWSDTWRGSQYAPYKGYGYSYQYYWCNSAGCNVTLANILTDGVANNYRPVYVGANSHAYVGYGWAQWAGNTDWTLAYCYPGWSENNNDDVWIWWHDFNAAVKMFVY
jgi:hypothetical protein